MKTLFLDRDGVINIENEGGYILQQSDFVYMKGVLEAMPILKEYFDLILVVTNQRCVGRGMISVADLEAIHLQMQGDISQAGGIVDKVYYAPALDREDAYRKPNTGMAKKAKEDYPAIDFAQSVMVGNNLSDMQFGKSMGMQTVFLPTTGPAKELPHPLIDLQFDSLWLYANSLR